MYISFEENGYKFYVNYFVAIFPCDLLNLSIVKINSARFTIKNPIAEINSVKFMNSALSANKDLLLTEE